jgi:ureidoacrylate peracid hydrolase
MRRRTRVLLVSLSSLTLVAGVLAVTPDAQDGPDAQEQPVLQSAPATITFQGREIPNTLDEILNPKHTAVIVNEMINDYLSPGGEYDKRGRGYNQARLATVLPPIQKVLATAREKGVRVIYVRGSSHADGSTSSDAQRMEYLSRGEPAPRLHIEGEWGWEVIDALKPQQQDLVLRKYRPDAFYGTILDSILRWNGIRTFVMVGTGAVAGVIPTLMTASNLGYFPVAVSDAIQSSDPKLTDDAMKYVGEHAIVKTHSEVVDSWSRSPSRPSGVVAMKPPGRPDEPSSVVFEGREIPISIEEILNPKHTVLLVQDMQNDFISRGGGYDKGGRRYAPARMTKIMPSVQKLLATARAKGVRVVYACSTSLPGGVTSSDPQIQSSWGANAGHPSMALTREGTWGWEIIDEVKPTPNDVVLRKYRPDAFFGTTLDEVLKWNGVKTIVLVGVDGEVGGLTTLMRANYLGYFRVAISDGILSNNPAGMESAMTFIGGQATLKTHQEVMDIWNKHRPRPTS